MNKPSKARSDTDLKLLEKFLSNNQFFSNLKKECDKEAIKESFKALTFRQYSSGQCVFNFGDYGKEFYIILSGSVSVKVPTQITIKGNRREILDFFVDNYDSIFWKKCENGDNLRQMAD